MIAEALLRAGGVVLVMRHALAPGRFDPPGLRLGECGTQRNLNEAGRAAGGARHARQVKMLRQTLVTASAPGRPFQARVAHHFVLSELAGENTGSGEGLVSRADSAGAPEVLARLNIG